MTIFKLARIGKAAILFFFVTKVSAVTTPPGTRLADPSNFKNGVLQIVDGNCQVSTPQGNNWRWFETATAGPRSFICSNEETHQAFTVSTQNYPATRVSDDYLKGVFVGLEKAAKESHRQLNKVNRDFISLPNKEAVGFAYSMQDERGQSVYSFGYIIPTGAICILQAITTEDHAPAYLLEVAGSVRTISDPSVETVFPIVRATASWLPYVFFGVVMWAIISAINQKRINRPRRNPWSWISVIVLLIAALNIFLLVRSKVFENMAEGQPAQAVGFVSAAPLMILLGLIWPWIRFIRANRSPSPSA